MGDYVLTFHFLDDSSNLNSIVKRIRKCPCLSKNLYCYHLTEGLLFFIIIFVQNAWTGLEESGDEQAGSSAATPGGPIGHWLTLMAEHMAAQHTDNTRSSFLWPKLFTGRFKTLFVVLCWCIQNEMNCVEKS